MIFVCCGSRGYQFDRLVKKLDVLCEQGVISGDEVFAQIASCTYLPVHYKYERFIPKEEYAHMQDEAELIISHAGAGSLIGALKKGKQVISVPRLFKYREHIDDHQLQISGVLTENGYLREVLDMDKLGDIIELSRKQPILRKYDKPSNIINIIDEFISKL